MVSTGESIPTSKKTQAKFRRHIERFQKGELTDSIIFMQSLHSATKSLSEDNAAVSVCEKGCSHCCKLSVDVTLVEADYIATRIKGGGYEFGYQAGFESESYCPFHNAATKACSIYEFRPIACQLFASLDSAEYCEQLDVPHKITTQHSIGVFDQIVEPIELASVNDKTPVYADIREWFRRK